MTDEVKPLEGVDEAAETAVQPDGVSKQAEPTAKEQTPKPKPVNLDELEEFRKYKSETQRRESELRRQLEERERALQEQQRREAERAEREFQQRLQQAPDDYSRLELQREWDNRRATVIEQQLQRTQQELASIRGQQDIERAKREWTSRRLAEFREELHDAFDTDVEIPRDVLDTLDAADHPTKVEAALTKFMRDKQREVARQLKEETRKRERTDDVDVGAGAPRSPSSEERKEWERATRSNDVESAFDLMVRRATRR